MKFGFDRNWLYLLALYVLATLFSLVLIEDADGAVQLFAILGLVALVVVTYEPFLRGIRLLTGSLSGQNEFFLYSVFIELNEKIHQLLETDDVLILLDRTLKERLKVTRTVFLVNREIAGSEHSGEINGATVLVPWQSDKVVPEFLDYAFEQNVIRNPGVVSINDGTTPLKKAFEETGTSLALPVVHNQRLLAVIFLARADRQFPLTELELQMFGYLANQLSIIFDRIRIYRQVMHKTEMDHAEKMQVMQSLSANIAHEMRTPLSGIRASITGIENYLPVLLQAYGHVRLSVPEGVERIRENHLATLKGSPDRIKLMIDQANAVIDMLLVNLRNNAFDQLEPCRAAACVEQAIDRYPFKSGEAERVQTDLDDDFQFMGVEILVIYILFNLLKNALYSIRSAQRGEIDIRLEKGVGSNFIVFRDTGEGVPAEVLERIFESFFTTKEDGTGAGLAFCKRTMRSFGGDIVCESVYGHYTEFRMEFPAMASAGDMASGQLH